MSHKLLVVLIGKLTAKTLKYNKLTLKYSRIVAEQEAVVGEPFSLSERDLLAAQNTSALLVPQVASNRYPPGIQFLGPVLEQNR